LVGCRSRLRRRRDRAGRELAAERGVEVEWLVADLGEWEPPLAAFDLVVVLYLQLPAEELGPILERAAAAVAPGGTLLVVGHHSDNLEHGSGGPKDPRVLFTPEDVAASLDGLEVEKAEAVLRPVEGERDAIDALVRARRAVNVVELRRYTLKPGARETLVELFDREFVESQEALGMRILGTFRDLDDPDQFVWLRGFDDMASRAPALTAYYTGPVWKMHKRGCERDDGGRRQRAVAPARRAAARARSGAASTGRCARARRDALGDDLAEAVPGDALARFVHRAREERLPGAAGARGRGRGGCRCGRASHRLPKRRSGYADSRGRYSPVSDTSVSDTQNGATVSSSRRARWRLAGGPKRSTSCSSSRARRAPRRSRGSG
jgi:hypothetical protein